MAELDVTMVPTLVTYKAMSELGPQLGLPPVNTSKNEGVFEAGCGSIEVAKRAGVALGFGTDLLGEAQPWQNRELAIRAELEPSIDVLRSMYRVNARLCGLEGEIGVIAPGACADLIVSTVDPIENLAAMAEPETALDAVICRGDVVVNRTA
jgi:imidazolonepropionase-like amidohydrolase